MAFRPALRLLAALDHRLLWRVPNAGNQVFLTFDDGPLPTITPWVLDTLATRGAKATFFCLGRQAEAHPELVRRISEEGHVLGHHTWGHSDGWRTLRRTYQRDVLRGEAAIGTRLFRPPYGHVPLGLLHALSNRYRVVMWDVMGHDYRPGRSGSACARHVLRRVRSGSIIVLHDNRKSAACLQAALVPILDGLARKGFVCAALPGPLTGR